MQARLDAGTKAKDGVCTLRGSDVVRIVQREFGVTYSLNGAYVLLHRLGYACLKPRPRHEHQDRKAQEHFKTETRIRRASSNSPALQLIDAIAVVIAQSYMLARACMTSHPSPVLRLAAVRDAMAWETALLERELAVFRQERERIPAKQRPHDTPTHRLEVLQIMRFE